MFPIWNHEYWLKIYEYNNMEDVEKFLTWPTSKPIIESL